MDIKCKECLWFVENPSHNGKDICDSEEHCVDLDPFEMVRTKKSNVEELQCAACGFIGEEKEFYNSVVHNKFKICPKCGTVRFVCDGNKELNYLTVI